MRQLGSPGEGDIFVRVVMRYQEKELEAELLVDTGCDMDVNMSEYKADQLGLPRDRTITLRMGQDNKGFVQRRSDLTLVGLLE